MAALNFIFWEASVLFSTEAAPICLVSNSIVTVPFPLLSAAFVVFFFVIGGSLLYSIVLVSATHQRDSATWIPMSPPSWTPPLHLSLPPAPLGGHGADLPGPHSKFWLTVSHMVIYLFILFSQLSHPLFPRCVHKSVLYVCISQIGSSVPSF